MIIAVDEEEVGLPAVAAFALSAVGVSIDMFECDCGGCVRDEMVRGSEVGRRLLDEVNM